MSNIVHTMETSAAGSTGRRERRQRRKRRRSPSYSSSTSSSTTSSVERANWRHKDKSEIDSNLSVLNQLCNQVQVLTNFMNNFMNNSEQPIATGLQTDVVSEVNNSREPVASCEPLQNEEFSFKSLHTTLKDPGVGKTDQHHFDIIKSLQLFESDDCFNINFIDTQKTYLSKPGFTELETNDDLKPFDKNKFLPSVERTLSALSKAVIVQRETLQDNVSVLLAWFKSLESVSFEEFSAKVNELFVEEKKFTSVSNDMIQIICGKRASIINNRRVEILKSIPNSFTSDKFKKIPPSSDFLFEPNEFNKLLEREGGPSKVFQKTQTSKKILPPFKGSLRYPSRNQHFQPILGDTRAPGVPGPSGNYQREVSFRGKRKYPDTKKPSGNRHGGSSKRRRYD